MFCEIWIRRDNDNAMLTNRLDPRDRCLLRERGFYLHARIDADTYESAQDVFVAWVRDYRLPDATEQAVDSGAMEAVWKQLLSEAV